MFVFCRLEVIRIVVKTLLEEFNESGVFVVFIASWKSAEILSCKAHDQAREMIEQTLTGTIPDTIPFPRRGN